MSIIEAVIAAITPTFEGTGIYLEEVTLTGGEPMRVGLPSSPTSCTLEM